MRKTSYLILALCWLSFGLTAGENLVYEHKNDRFEGYYNGVKPQHNIAVLVAHAWMGLGEHEKMVVDRLASLGYPALAADVYGEGVRLNTTADASAEAKKYYSDRKTLRERIALALDVLRVKSGVPVERIVAIGYCFGGTTVLELARDGSELAAVVSFHGGLKPDLEQIASNITTKVFALHGADDPYVPAEDVAAFVSEMKTQKVDWQLTQFGNAVHSFTFKSAGADNSKGAAYNDNADRRSWDILMNILGEVK
jgi:dienelactone hydrolase